MEALTKKNTFPIANEIYEEIKEFEAIKATILKKDFNIEEVVGNDNEIKSERQKQVNLVKEWFEETEAMIVGKRSQIGQEDKNIQISIEPGLEDLKEWNVEKITSSGGDIIEFAKIEGEKESGLSREIKQIICDVWVKKISDKIKWVTEQKEGDEVINFYKQKIKNRNKKATVIGQFIRTNEFNDKNSDEQNLINDLKLQVCLIELREQTNFEEIEQILEPYNILRKANVEGMTEEDLIGLGNQIGKAMEELENKQKDMLLDLKKDENDELKSEKENEEADEESLEEKAKREEDERLAEEERLLVEKARREREASAPAPAPAPVQTASTSKAESKRKGKKGSKKRRSGSKAKKKKGSTSKTKKRSKSKKKKA